MSNLCLSRLQEERKQWRKDHPFGFYARPEKTAKGELDLKNWVFGIPGKAGTIWEGGLYTVKAEFPQEYPSKPPRCKFEPGFYHPNVYPSGTICLSILNEESDWRPGLSVKDLVVGIQELLDNPNLKSPAQEEGYGDYSHNQERYKRKVKEQAKRYATH